jgi:hypothetical protein
MVLFGLVLLAPPRRAAVIQEAYQFFPDEQLPQDPPWERLDTPNGNRVQLKDQWLQIIDDREGNSGNQVPMFRRSLSTAEITSTDDYQVRARLRMTDFDFKDPNDDEDKAAFTGQIADGNRFVAFGVHLDVTDLDGDGDATEQRVVFLGPAAEPLGVVGEASGGEFLDVLLARTGGTVELYVNDTLVSTEQYSNFPTNSGAFRRLFWGGGSSPTTGTTELMGVSFGINAGASPISVPEPTAGLLFGATLVFLALRGPARGREQ